MNPDIFCCFRYNIFVCLLGLLLPSDYCQEAINGWPNPTCKLLQSYYVAKIEQCLISNVIQKLPIHFVFFPNSQRDTPYKYEELRIDGILLELPTNLFIIFSNLKHLKGNNVKLSKIHIGTFVNATKLETVELGSNSLSKLFDFNFSGARNIVRLDLSHNQIKTINRFAFNNLNILQELYLSGNEIESLDIKLFANNLQLDKLLLDNNRLQSIENFQIYGADNLRFLQLSANYIRTLNIQAFSNLKHLEILKVNNNEIQSIPNGLFSNNSALTILDLAKNCLNNVDFFEELNTPRLMQLNISDNYVKTIPITSVKNKLPSLVAFDIDKNNLNCTQMQRYKLELDMIEISTACESYTEKGKPISTMCFSSKETAHATGLAFTFTVLPTESSEHPTTKIITASINKLDEDDMCPCPLAVNTLFEPINSGLYCKDAE